jgi:hypothetical protein
MPSRQGRSDLEAAGRAGENRIEHLSRLSDTCLLLVGSDGDGREAPRVSLLRGEQSLRLDAGFLPTSPPSGLDRPRLVLLVFLPEDAEWQDATLVIETSGNRLAVATADLEELESDLQTLVRREFAPLEPSERADIMRFLTSALESVPDSQRYAVG